MERRSALIRLIICYTLCVSLFISTFVNIITHKKPPFTDIFQNAGFADNDAVFGHFFEEGLEKTVHWYLENQDWLDLVTSGEYRTYYLKMYGS